MIEVVIVGVGGLIAERRKGEEEEEKEEGGKEREKRNHSEVPFNSISESEMKDIVIILRESERRTSSTS